MPEKLEIRIHGDASRPTLVYLPGLHGDWTLIGQCKVGFMERPERVVLILLGALFNRWGVMAPVLWVLAALSTITVVHRITYTYSKTKHLAPIG